MSPNQDKHQDNQLTSYDYARLIQFVGQRLYQVKLNKTQINKILFYVYGRYAAERGEPLFSEKPKAWPYGPVFPIVYKKIDPYENVPLFDSEMQARYKENETAFNMVLDAVAMLHTKSAKVLTDWSHRVGSPWYETIYKTCPSTGEIIQEDWNTVIDFQLIADYFSKESNTSL